MISEKTYSPDWIRSFKKQSQYRAVNPALFEKFIYAFSLIEALAKSGLKFIFRGGTSMYLLPVEVNRFSIDVDIITSVGKEELYAKLLEIVKTSVFTNVREDESRAGTGGIPKAHYIFEYTATMNPEGTILLDVLFDDNPYISIVEAAIKNKWIDTVEPYTGVSVPSINSILGDKLTAFAPTTIGIPYSTGYPDQPDKRIEIIKQMYDISILIDHCTDIDETMSAFKKVAERQIGYSGKTLSIDDVIDDIFNTGLIFAKRERNNQEPEKSYFAELQDGLKKFSGFIITGAFRIDDAIASSAKAAYFTEKFRHNPLTPPEKYTDTSDLADWSIDNTEYNFLNRLKKTNKPAFFYWYRCLKLKNLLR